MTHWWTYVVPRVVWNAHSRYNRDIRIIEENRQYKLLVNGARESGRYIEDLWKFALRTFTFPLGWHAHTILVLGVAGGSVIHILHERFADARITGVDIDQTMIDIGRKFFGLGEIQTLTCVARDARQFLRKTTRRYDLIVVDIFIGPDVPDFVLDRSFHDRVRGHLAAGGSVLINYLRQPGYEHNALKLERMLKKRYASVRSADINNNRFFLGSSASFVLELPHV